MEAGNNSFRGAVSNILRYNLDANSLLFSNEDGKIEALNLPSNYLTYFDNLRDNIQLQIDGKSQRDIFRYSFWYKKQIYDIINSLKDSAPEQLNTLNELSTALNNDANFTTTIINLIDTESDIIDVEIFNYTIQN